MKLVLEKIAKLIDLKSMITLSLTIALIWGFIVNKVETKDFLVYVAIVFTYYFTKKDNGKEVNNMTTIENQTEEQIEATGVLTNEESESLTTGGEE